MLTLKDWRFIFRMNEHVAREAYSLGREDEKAGKSRVPTYFQVTGPAELVLKKKYTEFIENH